MLTRMRPARTVFSRDIGPLDVNAGDRSGNVREHVAGEVDCPQAMHQAVEALGGKRWAKGGHPEGPMPPDNRCHTLWGELERAELLSAVAVELDVDEARRNPRQAIGR